MSDNRTDLKPKDLRLLVPGLVGLGVAALGIWIRPGWGGVAVLGAADVGLIGVGQENTYGHPTSGALGILEAAGTTPLRSDLRGIVTVSSTTSGELIIWSER